MKLHRGSVLPLGGFLLLSLSLCGLARAATDTTLEIRWNPDWLQQQSLRITPLDGEHRSSLRSRAPLRWQSSGQSLVGIAGGRLLLQPPLLLQHADWPHALALIQACTDPKRANRLLLQDEGGQTWLSVDRLMFNAQLQPGHAFIRTSDVQLTPLLAARLQQPWTSGWTVAELRLHSPWRAPATPFPKGSEPPHWSGTPAPGGGTYQIDVFMRELTLQYTRCRGCDGPGGGDGEVVFTPNVTLVNNINDGTAMATVAGDPLGTSAALWTADVPWYTKFTPPSDPYQNDQHPFLIWNLYRLDANGAITPIGRSGLKHAFSTINAPHSTEHLCDTSHGNNVLGRACLDTYGVSSNDSAYDLGPRQELLPSVGIWARCGSIYDSNCDGLYDQPSLGSYDFRMLVRESQVTAASFPGSQWLIEAWYIIRDDINIYNSMGTRGLSLQWTAPPAPVWAVSHAGSAFRLGPAIERWLEAAPGNLVVQTSERLQTPHGQLQAAVRVTAVGEQYRYDYAVMNFDYRYGTLQGEAPNPRLTTARSIARIQIPHAAAASITLAEFADGDAQADNNWSLAVDAAEAVWHAPNAGSELPWGALYRFSFISNHPPVPQPVTLVANTGGGESNYRANLYAPGNEITFRDGFENP